ncbi:MAG: radical SAM protein, partial [Chitinophagales bacterium]|nr:radical SAM protein [Chitinophagales bacterium]
YKKRALSDLLKELDKVEGIEWIRLHYAYPSKFPLDVIETIRDSKHICHYLDMPLQHASNNMLKAMNRQITLEETKELITNIRNIIPDITLRTTMLVGFPGETEEDIDALCAFVEWAKFDRLGVFTYSHEEGTSGYALNDDIPAEVKAERAARVMEVQEEISIAKNAAKVGSTQRVLIDRIEGGFFIGRTAADSPEVDNEVLIDASAHYLRVGDFANIHISRAESFDLYGEPV